MCRYCVCFDERCCGLSGWELAAGRCCANANPPHLLLRRLVVCSPISSLFFVCVFLYNLQAEEVTVGATTIVAEDMIAVVGDTTEVTGEEDTGDMEVGVDTIVVGATGIEADTVIVVEGTGVTGVEVGETLNPIFIDWV